MNKPITKESDNIPQVINPFFNSKYFLKPATAGLMSIASDEIRGIMLAIANNPAKG